MAEETAASVLPNSSLPITNFTQIEIDQLSTVTLNSLASADSGHNQQLQTNDTLTSEQSTQMTQNNSAQLTTGDAMAVATNLALINATLLTSIVQFNLLNIFDNYTGDIILPNPDYLRNSFLENWLKLASSDYSSIQVNNQAALNNQSLASAQTGDNTQLIEQETQATENNLITGTAQSVTCAELESNLFYNQLLRYDLNFNILADWSGQIYGWEDPDNIQYPSANLRKLQQFLSLSTNTDENNPGEEGIKSTPSQLTINNQSTVDMITQATANTGSNRQELIDVDQATLETGEARALAQSYALVNPVFLDSQLSYTNLNILADWSGNLIFAYPDLSIKLLTAPATITEEQTVNYLLQISNTGLATARDIVLSATLPYVKSLSVKNQKVQHQAQSDTWSWSLATLAPMSSQQLMFTVSMDTLPTTLSSIKNLWQVTSKDRESMSNNQLLQFIPVTPKNQNESNFPSDQTTTHSSLEDLKKNSQAPKITLNISTNVHQFIYPGDSVLFNIKLDNQGDLCRHSQLHAVLLDPWQQVIGGGTIDLDDIQAKEKLQLDFKMSLPSEALLGNYQLLAFVSGEDRAARFYQSPVASSQFLLTSTGQDLTINKDFFELNHLDNELFNTPQVFGAVDYEGCWPHSSLINQSGPMLLGLMGILILLVRTLKRKTKLKLTS